MLSTIKRYGYASLKEITWESKEPWPLVISQYILYIRFFVCPETLLTNGLKDFNKTWYKY